MNAVPIQFFKECQLPKMYHGEANKLRSSRDMIGDTLFELTDPDKPDLLSTALKNHFWLFSGANVANARQAFFLLMRAFALEKVNVFYANTAALIPMLTDRSLDDQGHEFLDMVRTCDILFIDDFFDHSLNEAWSMDKMPLLALIRRRIENERTVVTYSSHLLPQCISWPVSFLEFLGFHLYKLPLLGPRK